MLDLSHNYLGAKGLEAALAAISNLDTAQAPPPRTHVCGPFAFSVTRPPSQTTTPGTKDGFPEGGGLCRGVGGGSPLAPVTQWPAAHL